MSNNTKTSKKISYLLRHGAIKEGLPIMEDGYVLIEDLLKHINDKKLTYSSLQNIVTTSDKKRFEISENGLYIRAAQGHSMSSVKSDKLMRRLTIEDGYNECFHGTNKKAAKNIVKTGLNKMTRNHIHFSIGMPGDNNVISGMRTNSEVVIVLDLKRALDDGIVFYLSSNNVILSEGLNGIIQPTYFKDVIY